MKTNIIGYSNLGLPLLTYSFMHGNHPNILFLSGVHGDETEGIFLCQRLIKELQTSPLKLNFFFWPLFNPDGIFKNQRQNHRGVDLNRNLPTKDWTQKVSQPRYYPGPQPASEPETQAFLKLLQNHSFKMIYSFHSWENCMLNINGPCRAVAEIIAPLTGYKITEDIGYPTPGSLGTYAGHERSLPVLTYELLKDMNPDDIMKTHLPAVIESLRLLEE